MAYTTHSSLLKEICEGREAAWNRFYAMYAPFIRGIGRRRELNPDETDELLQQTMISLFENGSILKYDPAKGSFRGYLYRIVRNKTADLYRQKHKLLSPDQEVPETDLMFESAFDAEYRTFVLNLLLEELKQIVSAENFEIFQFLELQEHSPAETADCFEIPVPRVYTIRKRCLEHLRLLAKRYPLGETGLES